MRQFVLSEGHRVADNGAVTGGTASGLGIDIRWQDGPLRSDGVELEPNGAFVEGGIQACIDRLELFQSTPFANANNVRALNGLRVALAALDERGNERSARGVGGTHVL